MDTNDQPAKIKKAVSNGERKERFYVGKEVRIVGGNEIGSKGSIVEVISSNRVALRLSKSDKEVIVRVRDIADLGSIEEEKCLKKLKGHKDSKGRKRSIERHEIRISSSSSWLNSHIRVRIISKELKGGRLYLQKGEIVDVVGPSSCDISMDDTRELIQGVEQEFLETAIPRRGGPVLVLFGRHKGVYGSLQEKDMDNDTAVVRDADTHALLNVRLEQIAEYVGEPDDIGY